MCVFILSDTENNSINNKSNKNNKISNNKTDKIGNVLGLAKKAGALCAGAELVINSVRKRKAVHIYISSDASEKTVKKLYDKTAFYSIPATKLELTMDELAHCVGLLRPTAAVSLTNINFLKLMEKCLKESDDTT